MILPVWYDSLARLHPHWSFSVSINIRECVINLWHTPFFLHFTMPYCKNCEETENKASERQR
jgi:hypothetical protein